MRFAKVAIRLAPALFQKSFPNSSIYPLRFASGGFFLVEYVTFVILAEARIQILNQVFDREFQKTSAQTESVENDRERVFSALVEVEAEY